jgi:hypothetical protein
LSARCCCAGGADQAEREAQSWRVVHDPTDPVGWLLFNVLAMVAEFEADLIRMRTRARGWMKVAKAKVRLRGKQPKLKPIKPSASSSCMIWAGMTRV